MMPLNDRPYLRGFVVLLVLAVLTWIEFQLSGAQIWLLVLIGLAKAALILQYFMHIARLRSRPE